MSNIPDFGDRFDPNKESDGKKIARFLVYKTVREYLDKYHHGLSHQRRVMILAGECPGREIALAKKMLKAKVTAFDVNQRAVSAASAAGADTCVLMDVSDLRFGHRDPWEEYYDFVNLDFCKTVQSDGIPRAIERGSMASRSLIATWFSYGHETMNPIDKEADWQIGLSRHDDDPSGVYSLPEKLRKRVLYIWKRVVLQNPGHSHTHLRALKVWQYKGNAMPMFVVLWQTGGGIAQEKDAFFEKVDSRVLRSTALRAAEEFSNEDVSLFFGCGSKQVAAWKAVDTRGKANQDGPLFAAARADANAKPEPK